MKFIKIILLLIASSLFVSTPAFAKKFKRALIIAGGGITPTVGLGIVEALREQGKAPDVIITTCGSSLAAMMLSTYGNPKDAFDYAKSEHFYRWMRSLRIETPSALDIAKKFRHMENNQDLIPNVYRSPLLSLEENFKNILPHSQLSARKPGPRFIIQATQALFSPNEVGQRRTDHLFQQVFFTDSDTAETLHGFTAPIRKLFPHAYVRKGIKIITNVDAGQAARASISDPFLINPAKIDGEYYFTGAVDLIPLELAHHLADEVISTYPVSLFEPYEDLVIRNTFGFKQSDRVLRAIQDTKVRWIDVTSLDDVSLEPVRRVLSFYNKIPKDMGSFRKSMDSQFIFGYARAKEAIKARNNYSHLRTPINPKLMYSFTCANANVWMTRWNKYCTSDAQIGCNRYKVSECSPIR